MHANGIELTDLAWAFGWLCAVVVLSRWGLGLPLASGGTAPRRLLGELVAVLGSVAVTALAVAALVLHDAQIDLTRERLHTPAPQALELARGLERPVRITYYYQGTDPNARRALDMLERMAGENALLEVTGVDPDKQPSLARTAGLKLYNAALIEAEGRRVLVHGTDEREFAIGIQRALRERILRFCFVEGHHERPIDNPEFRNEVERVGSHDESDPSSLVITTTTHGIGRWRRSLEGLGYEAARITLAGAAGVPADCSAVVVAGPRRPFAQQETRALRRYLAGGGAALFLLDVGYAPDPAFAALLAGLGVRTVDAVVVDPVSHYGTDAETVAVTGYDPHVVTERVAYTYYPGVRPLEPDANTDLSVVPLVRSSPHATRQPLGGAAAAPTAPPASEVLALASSGRLEGGTAEFRALVVGDVDFLSNAHYPQMSNGELALAISRWLVREEALAATAPHVHAEQLVMLTEAELGALYVLLVGLLPFSFVAGGLFVWWRRR